jgi:hypothetical protein
LRVSVILAEVPATLSTSSAVAVATRHARQEVQGGALGGEDGAGRARHQCQGRPGCDPVPICDHRLEHDGVVDPGEDMGSHLEPCDHAIPTGDEIGL